MATRLVEAHEIQAAVTATLAKQPVIDMHTHLYPPTFGTPVVNRSGRVDPKGLLLFGIDEMLTFHYLVAEVFRVVPASQLSYADFWRMSKQQQADHIWKHLFIERSPISEACRGVLTILQLLGLDPAQRSLDTYRRWFAQQDPYEYIDRIMQLSNVRSITMTNAVFDANERQRWLADANVGRDPRFAAVLRFDPLIRNWPAAGKLLAEWGYNVSPQVDQSTVREVQRFLTDWIDRTGAIYCAVSLPPTFRYPADPSDEVARAGQLILEQAVLPVCAQRGLPMAMMIGSAVGVNPSLGDAGDMVGKADVASVVNLCAKFADNRFLITMLSRENQHELTVAARKFGNLMIFGCWWFLNVPSIIDEMTRMRTELLGLSYIPQHSDSRVLEQLLYKWDHSRKLIGAVLSDKYIDLVKTRWPLHLADIERDVKLLLSDNFENFLASPPKP